MRNDTELCRTTMDNSDIAFDILEPAGNDSCARTDSIILSDVPFTPARPAMTCPVAAGMQLWLDHAVQPTSREMFGQDVRKIVHLGTYSCRRLYGDESKPWSEHATGNAIDVASFVLADGTQIEVLADWEGQSDKAVFLHQIRDEACAIFGTVLSPDYNAAHRDHFHLDQADRNWTVCR